MAADLEGLFHVPLDDEFFVITIEVNSEEVVVAFRERDLLPHAKLAA